MTKGCRGAADSYSRGRRRGRRQGQSVVREFLLVITRLFQPNMLGAAVREPSTKHHMGARLMLYVIMAVEDLRTTSVRATVVARTHPACA